MSDLTALGLVLVGLYLSECLVVARRGAVVLRLPFFFGGANAAPPSKAMGNGNVGLGLLNPLPPFGRVYVVEPWPFVCDPRYVVAAQATSLWMDGRPQQSGKRLAWADVKNVGVIDKDVRVDGVDFVRCTSPAHARAVADVLKQLAGVPDDERDAAITAAVTASLDIVEARRRVDAHAKKGRALLVATVACFAAFFVVTPLMIHKEGVERWFVWLALIYLWVITSAVLAFFAHRSLQPAAKGERWMSLLLSLPAPTVAIRGNDKLGRYLLAGLHPVVGALVTMQGHRRRDVVGALLRDLRMPKLPTLPVDDDVSRGVEAAFRARVAVAAEAVAGAEGVDVAAVFVAPGRTPLFCPRCLVGYTKGEGCSDCGGIPLVKREAVPTPAASTSTTPTVSG
ncbi:MAG TPA: hypothetical protein VGF99_07530 [Myxococcota bacterium]